MKRKTKEISSNVGCKRKNGALFLFCEKLKKSKSYWINSNTFSSLVLPKEAFLKWKTMNLQE